MKIAIITIPLKYNYGGILQAYALEEVLRREGHMVEHIEVQKDSYLLPLKTRFLVYAKRFVLKYIFGKRIRVLQESYLHDSQNTIMQNTQKFIDQYLHIRKVLTFEEIREADYDAFIVGSDQIWRAEYICKANNFAPFLDFTSSWNKVRLAYSCSFAFNEWRYSEEATKKASNLAKKFSAISVREKSGVDLCKKYLGVDAVQIIDPTMLLTIEDYEKIVKESDMPLSEGDFMTYILDENEDIVLFVDKVAEACHLKKFRANSHAEDLQADVKDRIQPPVEKWLKSFIDAKVVITDSFHACVFSIVFNKPFICLGNTSRGMDRFHSLLDMFNQRWRLITDLTQMPDMSVFFAKPNIDLQSYRNSGKEFLFKHIK